MRTAIMRGVYTDAIQLDGRTMIRTYRSGRQVRHVWAETDPETGGGVWLIADDEPTREHYELASRDASLGVGHVWTETGCPAYRSYDPAECVCDRARGE